MVLYLWPFYGLALPLYDKVSIWSDLYSLFLRSEIQIHSVLFFLHLRLSAGKFSPLRHLTAFLYTKKNILTQALYFYFLSIRVKRKFINTFILFPVRNFKLGILWDLAVIITIQVTDQAIITAQETVMVWLEVMTFSVMIPWLRSIILIMIVINRHCQTCQFQLVSYITVYFSQIYLVVFRSVISMTKNSSKSLPGRN